MRTIQDNRVGWWMGLTVASMVLGCGSHSALAQYGGGGNAQAGGSIEFRINTVRQSPLSTPDIPANGFAKLGVSGDTPTQWLEFELDFDSAPNWADNVEVRWYVLVAGETQPIVFSDSVTLINVKRGVHHVTAIFMPPRSVRRYAAQTGRANQVAVVMTHEGKTVAISGLPTPPTRRWWEDFSPVRGVLLNPLQTPFGFLQYDRFEQMRVSSPTP